MSHETNTTQFRTNIIFFLQLTVYNLFNFDCSLIDLINSKKFDVYFCLIYLPLNSLFFSTATRDEHCWQSNVLIALDAIPPLGHSPHLKSNSKKHLHHKYDLIWKSDVFHNTHFAIGSHFWKMFTMSKEAFLFLPALFSSSVGSNYLLPTMQQDGLSRRNSNSLTLMVLKKFRSLHGSLCWWHCPKQGWLSQRNSNSLKLVIFEKFQRLYGSLLCLWHCPRQDGLPKGNHNSLKFMILGNF